MPEKVNWYVSCSPRSPEKIQPELQVLIHFQNQIWRGKAGNASQEAFAKSLVKLPQFLGSTHEKEASFSTRDRVAPMKTYGFVYIGKDGTLKITNAGKMLAENRRPKDIFLKQLSKWQYPSSQHKNSQYPEENWALNPFIFVLRLLKEVEYLSKLDIAMFALTVTHNNQLDEVANEITTFRSQYTSIIGENNRLSFINNYFYRKFKKIYVSPEIIREGKSKDKIQVKIQNAIDVADSTTRYFRYTGLFVARGNKLVLNSDKMDIIDELIMTAQIVNTYEDVELFHEYFGNPSVPQLSFENGKQLFLKASTLYSKNIKIAENITPHFPNVYPEIKIQSQMFKQLNENSPIEKLKDSIYFLQELQLELRVKYKQLEYQNVSNIQTVLDYLKIYFEKRTIINDFMKDRFLANKNTIFEWLVWNGFIILGNALEYKNNFIIDEELLPVTHAAGNQSDMEIIYKDFVILGEVTTSSGATQFKMESEPITRHYHTKQKELGSTKDLYCLFIAPSLNNNTISHFADYNDVFDSKIIPLSLEQYIELLQLQQNLIQRNLKLSTNDLKEFLDLLLYTLQSNIKNDVLTTKVKIQEALDEWKYKFN